MSWKIKKRKIKFRAWAKKMKSWDEICKETFAVEQGVSIPVPIGLLNNDENWCQFTGFKDKNNKEIYEGDIVVFNLLDVAGKVKKRDLKCVIEWSELGEFIMRSKNNITYLPGMIPEQLKIMGNIFENKELLN